MVNTRAPFRIFAALTFPLTMFAAAHAQTPHTRVSGGVEDRPFGAAAMHVSNTPAHGSGAGVLQAFGGAVRAADPEISFDTANGAAGTAPSYSNNRFAGDGGSSAVTPARVPSHDSGQQ